MANYHHFGRHIFLKFRLYLLREYLVFFRVFLFLFQIKLVSFFVVFCRFADKCFFIRIQILNNLANNKKNCRYFRPFPDLLALLKFFAAKSFKNEPFIRQFHEHKSVPNRTSLNFITHKFNSLKKCFSANPIRSIS